MTPSTPHTSHGAWTRTGVQAPAAWNRLSRLGLLALVALGVLFYRRPDQFTHPYVWVEDGTVNLPQFIEHGWGFLAEPIVGYIILPIRLILGAAATLSFRWLPEITFVLMLGFTVAVLAAVAFSPTRLRHRFLCAVSVLLIPSGSEVFGVSLYAGWWGSLLAMLPLLWREDHTRVTLRSALLIVGGLSTPIAVALLPFYLARAWLFRRRGEIWMLALCLLLAAIQLVAMWSTSADVSGSASATSVPLIVEKFFGHFVFWTADRPQWLLYPILGACLIGFLAWTACVHRSALGWPFPMLCGLLAVSIGMSIARVPVEAMHSILAGPRYFFMPYTVLMWMLLYVISRRHMAVSLVSITILALSLRATVLYGPRTHAAIDWRQQVDQCVGKDSHAFPVHYEGDAPHGIMWSATLAGASCRTLVTSSVFDNEIDDAP